jgi:hypothetical protein
LKKATKRTASNHKVRPQWKGRKLSQSSELEASLVGIVKDGSTKTSRQREAMHQKSKSTALVSPEHHTRQHHLSPLPSARENSVAASRIPNRTTSRTKSTIANSTNPLHIEIPSSAGQTSTSEAGGITDDTETSESETDHPSSSATASPLDSPTTPALPELWPAGSRQLFPFASQPPTPAAYHSSYRPPTPRGTGPRAPSRGSNGSGRLSPSSSLKSLSMTPAREGGTSRGPLSPTANTSTGNYANGTASSTARMSSPEQRYRKLFHGNRTANAAVASSSKEAKAQKANAGSASNSGKENQPTKSKTGVRRVNALGLEIDISGTRGMVMRRSRK